MSSSSVGPLTKILHQSDMQPQHEKEVLQTSIFVVSQNHIVTAGLAISISIIIRAIYIKLYIDIKICTIGRPTERIEKLVIIEAYQQFTSWCKIAIGDKSNKISVVEQHKKIQNITMIWKLILDARREVMLYRNRKCVYILSLM